jgi:hypothetical protein
MEKNFRIVMDLTDDEMKVANKIFTKVALMGWTLDYGCHGTSIANKFFPAQWQAKIEKDVSDRKEEVWVPSPAWLEIANSHQKKEPCNCIVCHRLPQWVQDSVAKNMISYLDKQCKDAGLLAHSAEEQELEMWKTLALAMSKLVLEYEK